MNPRSSNPPETGRRRRRVRSAEQVSGSAPPLHEAGRARRRIEQPIPAERPVVQTAPEEIPAPAWLAVARGVALFLGAFTLLNLLGEIRGASHDANLWWIDLRPCSTEAARGFLGITGALLMLFAVHPQLPRFFRGMTVLCVLAFFGAALWNAYQYYEQIRGELIHAKVPVAFSLHVAACLAVVFSGLLGHRGRSDHAARDLFVALLTIGLCIAGFPIAQFFCQGKTDYRGAADAAVVFACDAPPGKNAVKVLEARVRTASQLYQEKLVRKVMLTGVSDKDGVGDAESLRRLAIESGVLEADVIFDSSGTATEAAVKSTIERFEEHDLHEILVISDFYLLPRIKLCYRRFGKDVDSIPAEQPDDANSLRALRHELVHEATALWVFYLQPLVL